MKPTTKLFGLRGWRMLLLQGALLSITCVTQAQLSYTETGTFGLLDQNNANVSGPYGNNGCAPTAIANGLIWLNNTYGPVGGFNGAGGPFIMPGNGTYNTVTALGTFMGTTSSNGTSVSGEFNGLAKYIGTTPPGQGVSPPITISGGQVLGGVGGFAQVQNSKATPTYLYNQLFANNSVELGIDWGTNFTSPTFTNGGHELTLVGISINAAGNAGSVTLLDPSGTGTGAVKYLGVAWSLSPSGYIYMTGLPATDVDNAQGYSSGIISDDLIVSAPEPTTFALLGVGVIGAGMRRFFRRAKV